MSSQYVNPSLDWFENIIGLNIPQEGEKVELDGCEYIFKNGILRSSALLSAAQEQTSDTFGFKWSKRDTFEGEAMQDVLRNWLLEKYGDVTSSSWFKGLGENPVVLDAGCGASNSALVMFDQVLEKIRYIGVDVSEAVDVAKLRFHEKGIQIGALQSDLMQLPLPDQSVDLIFSEGVLHHTDDTKKALKAVNRHLKVGGYFLFYVYRKKGPIREFTDDYIREKLQNMSPQESWQEIKALTALGETLGDLDIEIDIKENIDLLDIPAGTINLQRLFYWHIFKAFYRPEMTFDEMNHINFDWYAPKNAHRQTLDEVREWCSEIGLSIEHETEELAGLTIIAKKTDQL
ncbi:conserved hypothetical protein [Candidatus Terasakiella magnetica]|uniref:Methyltransferase type 11 domain-containing protein n=2 Tax=Candidatus Terasakiella magnetica TaxID=1867952 RepID=A0A1C3RG13_9PROT|nr:conserved hypothetical protein [Candidatus Terasakiella magnetica]